MKKILVVDDERLFLMSICALLKSQGYSVSSAQNGQEAWNAIQKEKPDFLVLDIMMPVMDGYTLIVHLREDPLFKDLPILLLTCKEDIIDPGINFMKGVQYLHKSCTPEELFAVIKNILK